jgi:hypothetical protein
MLPESDERVSLFSANDVNSTFRNGQSLKKHTNILGLGYPRQVLKTNYDAHCFVVELRSRLLDEIIRENLHE